MGDAKAQLQINFDTVREKNIEQLRVLNRAIFPINYNEKVYQDILACGEVTQLAYHNDVLVGAIGCRLEKTPQVGQRDASIKRTLCRQVAMKHNTNPSPFRIPFQGPKLYIITLGVLAPYRGMGVGARLLEKSLSVVETSLPEVKEACLHVQSNNEEAIAFYSKFGFQVKETIKDYYRRLQPPDAVLLSKVLGMKENGTT